MVRRSLSSAEVPPSIRAVALTIEALVQGGYAWVLIERDSSAGAADEGAADGSWSELQRAAKHFETYGAALAAGVTSLQALSDDLGAGPLAQTPPGTHASHAGSERSVRSTGRTAAKDKPGRATDEKGSRPPKGGAFGFGGVRR